MLCPKCKFISFDDLSTCAKCSNDLSALMQELQGTGTEARVPFFLSSVVQAPELEEESFSESQAMPALDDSQVNLEDTLSFDDSMSLDLDESIEVSGDDIAIDIGEVMPVDLDQIDLSDSAQLEDTTIDGLSFDTTGSLSLGEDDINFDDDIDLNLTDDFDSTEIINKDEIDLDLTGDFEKSGVELDFGEVDLDATGISLAPLDASAVASTTDTSAEELDLDEDLLAVLADDSDDTGTEESPGVDLSFDDNLTGEFDGIEDSLDNLTGEFESIASSAEDDISADDLEALLDDDLEELDASALAEIDDDLDDTQVINDDELGDFASDDLEFDGLDDDTEAESKSLDLDDIDVSDLVSSSDDSSGEISASEDDEVNLSSLMEESADEGADDDFDLDMLDEDLPEVELIADDDDEGPPDLPV
jgi:hypothetical protein